MEVAQYAGRLKARKTFIPFMETAEELTQREKESLSMQKILEYTEKFCSEPSVGYFEFFLGPLVCKCAAEGFLSKETEALLVEPFLRILDSYERHCYLDPQEAAGYLQRRVLENKKLSRYGAETLY